MKSSSHGTSRWRIRSARKKTAPFRTPTRNRSRPRSRARSRSPSSLDAVGELVALDEDPADGRVAHLSRYVSAARAGDRNAIGRERARRPRHPHDLAAGLDHRHRAALLARDLPVGEQVLERLRAAEPGGAHPVARLPRADGRRRRRPRPPSPPDRASTSQSPKRTRPGSGSAPAAAAAGARRSARAPYSTTARSPLPDVERHRAAALAPARAARSARTGAPAQAARSTSRPSAGRQRRDLRPRSSVSARQQRVERLRLVAQQAARSPRSSAPPPGAIRSSSGSSSWRTRARVKRGSAFDGSVAPVEPVRRGSSASVSARVMPSSGRTSRPRRGAIPSSARAPGRGARAASAPSRPGRRACGRSRSRRRRAAPPARSAPRARAPGGCPSPQPRPARRSAHAERAQLAAELLVRRRRDVAQAVVHVQRAHLRAAAATAMCSRQTESRAARQQHEQRLPRAQSLGLSDHARPAQRPRLVEALQLHLADRARTGASRRS